MATVFIERTVGTREVPASVRALSSLPEIDYADRFSLVTDAEATPEDWARAMFGDVPGVAGWFIWRGVLGLRLSLDPPSKVISGSGS